MVLMNLSAASFQLFLFSIFPSPRASRVRVLLMNKKDLKKMSKVKTLSASDSALALRKFFPAQMAVYTSKALTDMFEEKEMRFSVSEETEKSLFPERYKEEPETPENQDQTPPNPEIN